MTVWAGVHAGDQVRGADQRVWTVTGRAELPVWALAGAHARYTLRLGDREVQADRRLADPAPLVAKTDHTALGAAVNTLLNAGLMPVLLEDKTMTDPFAAPAALAEPKHDRYGRYLLPDPETGKEKAWTRVSTVARTLADEYGLTQWKLRMAAKGIALRPDLIAAAAAADVESDKKRLDEIAESAMERAGSGAGANLGTALHTFTQRLDQGEPLSSLGAPAPLDQDLVAYAALLKSARLGMHAIERIVCLPELGVAGRFDRIVSQPPGEAKADPLTVLDLKTGKELSYAWLEIAIQQAMYANAPLMWDPTAQTWVPKPVVDLTRALVLHLPVGKAAPQLYAVDLIKGWAAAQTAMKVREMRSGAKSLAWVVKPDDPTAVALHQVSQAADQQALAALWDQLNRRGLWTEEVNAAAHARLNALIS
jgi:hypothetical protein